MTQPTRRILGTQFVKLNKEGEVFTDSLVDRVPIMINGNDTFRYTLLSNDVRYRMNGTDQIDDALAELKLGTPISVKFLGTEKTLGGFEVKRFLIEALEDGGDKDGNGSRA